MRVVDATSPPDVVFAEGVRPLFLPTVVPVIGPPGAGRATHASRVAGDFPRFAHLSLRAIVEGEVTRRTPLGLSVEAARGALPADEALFRLLRAAMAASPASAFVLDAFPSTAAQADALESGVLGGRPPLFVIHLDVPRAAGAARLMKRFAGARSAGGGNTADDDSAVAAAGRAYDEGTAPLLRRYARLGLLRPIAAAGPVASVYVPVRQLFQPAIAVVVGAAGAGAADLCARAGLELGYQTLDVDALIAAESASGEEPALGAPLAAALAARRSAPVEAVCGVLAKAMAGSAASKFLLVGYPRVISVGYPSVHDQVRRRGNGGEGG